MWYGIMKEFDCQVSSTWSVCGEERAEAFTHRHVSPDKKEEISQLDHIIRPKRRNDEIYIHNERRLWATWHHYLHFRENRRRTTCQCLFQKRYKKWTGWKPTTEEQLIRFKKGSHEKTRETQKKISRLHRRRLRTRPTKYNTEPKHRKKK